jgi:outer membrane protein insertion porin family
MLKKILKNFFNKKAWKPIPMGDGQQLSLRAQFDC